MIQINTTPPPILGTLHQWTYPAGQWTIEITGEVLSVTPPILVLGDFMIFSDDPSGKAVLGITSALMCKAAFLADVRALGYTHVRLIGHRVSGAAAGRQVDLTIPC